MSIRKVPEKSSHAAQVFKFGSINSRTGERDAHSPRPTSMYKQRHVKQTNVKVLASNQESSEQNGKLVSDHSLLSLQCM